MGVKSNIKLIFDYFKLNIKKEWKYKTSFFMQILMMILNDLFFIIQWYIIFTLVDNIGGYGFKETMLLWSMSAAGYGFSHAFFCGAWNISEMVYEGKLDVYLTQPKNVLINVCCSSTDVSAIGDMVYAFVVLVIVRAPWYWYLIMIPTTVMVGLLYAAVRVVYSSFSFYMKRGDSLAKSVESIMNKAGQYPPAIYSTVAKGLLFTLVPIFFYTFIPTQYLLIQPNLWWIFIFALGVTVWVVLAFFCFSKGLKKYNSGSLMGGRV